VINNEPMGQIRNDLVEGHGRNGMAMRRWKTMTLAFGMIATTLSMQGVSPALARSTSQIPNVGGSNALKVALKVKRCRPGLSRHLAKPGDQIFFRSIAPCCGAVENPMRRSQLYCLERAAIYWNHSPSYVDGPD
jgi:hypothetical protein